MNWTGRLSGMPLVLDASSGDGERVDALIVWTETSDIYDVDPEAPDATLLDRCCA